MEYEFHWNIVFQKMPQLLHGAFVTLHLSVSAMLIGIVIAVLLAIAKMSKSRMYSLPATIWVEIARNHRNLQGWFSVHPRNAIQRLKITGYDQHPGLSLYYSSPDVQTHLSPNDQPVCLVHPDEFSRYSGGNE